MSFAFDGGNYPYPSRRRVIYAKNGMVCTSQPLAAQAGLRMLLQGGNAIDAAIATAITLTVVEPTSNGLGSDAFGLIWTKDKLYGINGSGPAPLALTPEALAAKGITETIPDRGWHGVNVPGAPSAWAELHKRFGKLPFAKLFEPAIEYAENGFPVSPIAAKYWQRGLELFTEFKGRPEFAAWFETFVPEGKAPKAGDIMKMPFHAKTLRLLAETYCESYYHGEIAKAIADFSRATEGYITEQDLERYKAEWVEPISINYRGYEVWEMPPNGHGITALMALNMLKGFDFEAKDKVETYHKQLEAMKLAYVDAKKYVTDPKYMKAKVEDMLSEAYAAKRRALIGEEAIQPEAGDPFCGGTVYMCAADGEGNMVSFIQSNFKGFGSGVVIPGYGISLNDRGCDFKLDPQEENYLVPGKKSYHTIIPGFMTKEGKPVGPFGVMGGYMQPQGHVQVVMNTVDFLMNPQSALDCPRWQWVGDKRIQLEDTVPQEIIEGLKAKGHEVEVMSDYGSFGRGQIIWKDEKGTLCGATEPRTDGTVAAF